MTEQEQIIADFKAKCEEIISKGQRGYGNDADQKNINKEISDEANEVINRHSNMPNIDVAKLTEEIDKIVKAARIN